MFEGITLGLPEGKRLEELIYSLMSERNGKICNSKDCDCNLCILRKDLIKLKAVEKLLIDTGKRNINYQTKTFSVYEATLQAFVLGFYLSKEYYKLLDLENLVK